MFPVGLFYNTGVGFFSIKMKEKTPKRRPIPIRTKGRLAENLLKNIL